MKHVLPSTTKAFAAALALISFSAHAQHAKIARPWAGHIAHTARAEASRHVATTVIVPGRSVNHSWDGTRWYGGSTTTYTYNPQGKPTQMVFADSATNALYGKYIMNYDGQGLLSEFIYQDWAGSAFRNNTRELYAYDSHGRETLYTDQQWLNNAWVTQESYRTTNTYNTAGTLISQVFESLNIGTNTWQPEERQLYTVDANNRWTEVVGQEWTNGAYVNEFRTRNITWYNWATLLPSYYEDQEWIPSSNTWGFDTRTTLSYQPNGSYASVLQELTAPNTWVNEDRHTYTYDNYGNEILHQGEGWANNAWFIDHGNSATLAYTATNQVRRSLQQNYNSQSRRYEKSSVTTYSNFVTLGARPAALLAEASLYPNPARNATTLVVAGLREQGPVPAEVLNTVGQVVATLALRPQQGTIRQELNLAGLTNGLYTVRLHTADGTLVRRVVKQ
ncbi:T9SS type A sorting domain-containing protein [Hymenobacter busanensis]|uniref:T9SS type A sorting domain-containing protein n=1 Tax=Hymenobacter busanensis TaxID=2607656 RepID=A0A7L4ZWW7_9BACT|nr:T9SS type A sorting domain-containing protein [Hymenobacter busanensis]KAA9332144.1 T9SS type A sorting domain-containing protein [Hymenobacter busanensis]QHJ07517.1 T9SS type A sorting domain-containing protein [Hymenobacter busanensis]